MLFASAGGNGFTARASMARASIESSKAVNRCRLVAGTGAMSVGGLSIGPLAHLQRILPFEVVDAPFPIRVDGPKEGASYGQQPVRLSSSPSR